MTTLIIVALGVIGACAIAYHFGTIVGAERVRDGVKAVRGTCRHCLQLDGHGGEPCPYRGDGEVTLTACKSCLQDVRRCACPKVLLGREGSA